MRIGKARRIAAFVIVMGALAGSSAASGNESQSVASASIATVQSQHPLYLGRTPNKRSMPKLTDPAPLQVIAEKSREQLIESRGVQQARTKAVMRRVLQSRQIRRRARAVLRKSERGGKAWARNLLQN